MRRAWPALVLASMLVAVFWRVLVGGEGLSSDGTLATVRPWSDAPRAAAHRSTNPLLMDQYLVFNANEEFISRWVRRGVWPLWNPDLGHGMPTVASVENAEYFPTNLLLWLLAPFWSRGVRAMLRIALCFAATYGLGRAIGLRRAGATFAALSFAFCAFNVVYLASPVGNVSCTWPVILWTLERLLQTGSFAWGAGLALAGGAALLGGHPPMVFHGAFVAAVWLGCRLLTTAPPARIAAPAIGWRLALCGLAAAGIGSAAILPWTEYVVQNPTDLLSLRHQSTLSWKALVVWAVPDFYGTPVGSSALWDFHLYALKGWENYCERTAYVGVAALLLAGTALAAGRARDVALPCALVLAATVALAYDPPIVGRLARELPGFRIATNTKMIVAGALALSILGGLGLDELGERGRATRAPLVGALVVAAALAALAATLWPNAEQREWIAAAEALDAFRTDCLWAALVAVVVLAAALVPAARGWSWARAVVLGVAMCDLWRFAIAFNPTIAPAHVPAATDGIRFLQAHAGDARVLSVGLNLLPANTMLRYGIGDVRGMDWVGVRHYQTLLTGRPGESDWGWGLEAMPDTLPALNVSFAVLPAGTPIVPSGSIVYDRELRIVRVANGLPRAQLVHDVRGVDDDRSARALIAARAVDLRRTVLLRERDRMTIASRVADPRLPAPAGEHVRVVESQPNEVRLAVRAAAPGVVVLNDTFFPGWRCEVNGAPVPILRANVAFRGVAVAAGDHEIMFRYRPWRALAGIGLALGTLCGIATLAILRCRRARRKPGPER